MKGLTKHGDIFSLCFGDVCKPGIELSQREGLGASRVDQLRMVIAQRLDILQLIKPLLLLDIVWAGEGISGSLLEPPLHRQVCLGMLRSNSLRASVEVGAKEVE